MLSLDACRMVLGALADNKSDDEIAHMREQAMAVARIVIRTYFGGARSVVTWLRRSAVRRHAGFTR